MKTRLFALAALPVASLLACGSDPPPPPVAPPTPPPVATVVAPPTPKAINDDDFAWLEDINGEKSIAFAKAHNAVSEGQLTATPGFDKLQDRLAAIMSSKDKIPAPHFQNGKIRNFWTDKDHQRGIWRETTLAEYKKAEPAWVTLLDVDALNKAENASYVYHGANCLYPAFKKCLVSLSKGGSDASITREFDVDKKEFVKGGFELPEGKHNTAWKDADTLYVGTDFGAGSLTRSGYARIMKEWKRGTPLTAAKQVFEVKDTDIGTSCWRAHDHGRVRDMCTRAMDMEREELFLRQGDKTTKIEKPDDADFSIREDDMLMRLKADWTPTAGGKTFKNGSLVTAPLKSYLAGKRDFQVLFEPDAHSSLEGSGSTKSFILLHVITDVRSEVRVLKRANPTAPWTSTTLKESVASVNMDPFDYDTSDDAWVWLTDFTVPSTLALQNLVTNKREPLKKMPSFYDASNVESTQHFATSKDGTKIPYFEVGTKGRTAAGPTILTAYGGFGLSMTPNYAAKAGASWIERGGTYVLANIRGGEEYGPEWHHAAMLHNRQKAYDDMAAVSEDLIKRGVATNKSLGIVGGSNGGLLVSVMLTQRPELYGAVVSMAPLTDMRRYHKLLAGASWMGEYGDPDNAEDWAAISKYSPFQNIKPGMKYPPMFYTASTKDDRVHPSHARKMVAKLEADGYQPLFYENIEGGHGGSADYKQAAHVDAMMYSFFATRLGLH